MKRSNSFFLIAVISSRALSAPAPTVGNEVLLSRTPTRSTSKNHYPILVPRAANATASSCPTKDEKCKRKCFSKDWFRDRTTCDCRPCPADQKANALNNGCEPDNEYQQRKGKCNYGSILDTAEGGQDDNTQKPVCIPDDQDLCNEEGTIPRSRDKKDTKILDETECAPDMKEEDKPKCKSNEYRFIEVWESDGGNSKSTKYSCRKTRKFSRDKGSKFDGVRQKKKPEFDEKKKQEDDDRKKWQHDMEKQDEENKNNRKKSRMGQCLMIVALSLYDDDTLVDYAVDFFDEEFVSGEFLMAYWPSDLEDVPADSVDINTEKYMQQFVDAISDDSWIVNHIGPGGKRSESPRESVEYTDDITALDSMDGPFALVPHTKRWVQFVISAIGAFLTRLGPIVARAGSGAARLQKLIKKGGAKLAKPNQSKAKSQKDQENAADSIAKNKNWDNCIRGKSPEKN